MTAPRVTTWSRDSSVTLTWFQEWAGGVLLGNPLLPTGERRGGKRTRDAQLATLLLLRPRDWGNRSSIEVLVNKKKLNKRLSTRPSSGGGSGAVTISWWAVSSISGSPTSGPLAGLTGPGWAGRPACSPTLPGGRLLRLHGSEGSHRRASMATSRLRGYSRSGSSRFPLMHDVFDRLSLLLCCRELLGKILESIAEEAGLQHGSI